MAWWPSTLVAAVLVIVVAAAFRVAVNDVPTFSRADETVYLNQARFVATNGWTSFAVLVSSYVGDPASWPFPTPRWSYLAVAGPACALAGPDCSFRTLAWVSTMSGVASAGLVWAIARRLFGPRAAFIAGLLAVTSVIHLAMGRRALQDEFVAAVTLLAIWATVSMLFQPDRRWPSLALAIAALTVAFGAKDNTFLYLPALALLTVAFWMGRGVRLSEALVLVLPPVLHVAIYSLLGGGVPNFLGVVRIVLSQSSAYDYIRQYQSGPPHEVLVDLLLVSPVIMLVGIVAWERLVTDPPAPRHVPIGFAAMSLAAVLAFAFFPKDLRYLLVVDSLLRIVVASLLANWWTRERLGRVVVVAMMAGSAATELILYHAVFVAGAVYDPVLINVLRALNAVPR